MLVVTTDHITGKNLEMLGIAKGTAILTKHMGKDFISSIKSMTGGELTEYTKMTEESRELATDRMILDAEKAGADAVVNVRFTSSEVMPGASEMTAYGTAVKFVD